MSDEEFYANVSKKLSQASRKMRQDGFTKNNRFIMSFVLGGHVLGE